ncbi:MAG: metal-dependent hydrolase [Microgenomates group bacterium]
MTTFTHTVFGIVLAKISVDTGMIPAASQVIYPLSIIAANLPDFDVLYVPMSKNHRESLMHTPLFWLVVIGCLYVVATLYPTILPYIHILTIGVVSHFLMDTACMRSGIRWLYPFNKKFFNVLHSVTDMHLENKKVFIKTYLTHPVMIAESAVLFVIALVYLKL